MTTLLSPKKRVLNTVFRSGITEGLDIRVKLLTRSKVTAVMYIHNIHLNYTGFVNGGALMAFADLIGAAGASMNKPADFRGGTIESKTNFFVPGKALLIHALSIRLHIGRTTSVWQTKLTNSDGKLVAVVTQTQISLPPAK